MEPADSATYMVDEGERGSGVTARIFDFSMIGLPYLLSALAARLALFAWSALESQRLDFHLMCEQSSVIFSYSVSKKFWGSEDLNMMQFQILPLGR